MQLIISNTQDREQWYYAALGALPGTVHAEQRNMTTEMLKINRPVFLQPPKWNKDIFIHLALTAQATRINPDFLEPTSLYKICLRSMERDLERSCQQIHLMHILGLLIPMSIVLCHAFHYISGQDTVTDVLKEAGAEMNTYTRT